MFENGAGQLADHVSLLNNKMAQVIPAKKIPVYKVYIEDAEGSSYSTRLSSEVVTIDDAITEAISNFNRNLATDLPIGSHLRAVRLQKWEAGHGSAFVLEIAADRSGGKVEILPRLFVE
jgi:hypothetical protein